MSPRDPSPRLAGLAPDLTRTAPRGPRALLGGYALAARVLDKCRAELVGRSGEFHYNCPLDQGFFRFTGIDPARLREFVAGGADDDQVAAWIAAESAVTDPAAVGRWSRRQRLNPLLWVLALDDWQHVRRHRARDATDRSADAVAP